mmetsp:Transcript_14773/g.27340  ORF Transcript_14773/g.27340 Transcript_14773/m.27340 type:complete len:107 (-) Transcript_14773:88-408(-)
MSIITEWIENLMEDPAQRQRNQDRLINVAFKYAQLKKAVWDMPVIPAKGWTAPYFELSTANRVAEGGSDGKQSKMMASATLKANSYDGIMDLYHTRGEAIHAKTQA